MSTGQGLDRVTITPEQGHGLVNPCSPLKGVIGGHQVIITHANSLVIKTIYRSSFIPYDCLGLGFNFLLDIMGIIGSNALEDVTLNLDAVEPDGTRTTILSMVTVSLAAETDKPFSLRYQGKVSLEQVTTTSGKIAAVGELEAFQTTPYRLAGASAIAGVSIDFRNGLYLELQADWDAAHANASISTISAVLQVCNLPGGEG